MLRLTAMEFDLILRQSSCANACDGWSAGHMSICGLLTNCLLCGNSSLLAQLARSTSTCLTYWSSWSYLLRHVRHTCDDMSPSYVQLFGLSSRITLPCNIPVGEELEVLASDRRWPRPASFLLLSPSAIRLMSQTHPRLCLQLRAAFVGNAVPDSCLAD